MNGLKGLRVLVTGYPGFVSMHLVERLKKEGALIFVFKNPSFKGDLLEKQMIKDRIKVFDTDITNFNNIHSCVKKINSEIIFHLAAYTNAERTSNIIDQCIKVNIEGTANLLRALKRTKYKSFVNISSTEVYGPISVPFKEVQRAQPISPYGMSKLAAEHICNFYFKIYHSPIVNLRISMIYGEFQPEDKIIPHLMLSCLKKKDLQLTAGRQTKDFVYIGDVVEALVRTSLEKKANGETINIGSGHEITIYDLVLKVVEKTKISGKINFGTIPVKRGEIMRMRVTTIKAKKILGWKPRITLEKGLEKVIISYL